MYQKAFTPNSPRSTSPIAQVLSKRGLRQGTIDAIVAERERGSLDKAFFAATRALRMGGGGCGSALTRAGEQAGGKCGEGEDTSRHVLDVDKWQEIAAVLMSRKQPRENVDMGAAIGAEGPRLQLSKLLFMVPSPAAGLVTPGYRPGLVPGGSGGGCHAASTSAGGSKVVGGNGGGGGKRGGSGTSGDAGDGPSTPTYLVLVPPASSGDAAGVMAAEPIGLTEAPAPAPASCTAPEEEAACVVLLTLGVPWWEKDGVPGGAPFPPEFCANASSSGSGGRRPRGAQHAANPKRGGGSSSKAESVTCSLPSKVGKVGELLFSKQGRQGKQGKVGKAR